MTWSIPSQEGRRVCDIIERIESFGIDLDQFRQVLKKRPGPLEGKWSAQSISLIALGVVEEEWKRRIEVDER